jgi:hypothetical protein
MRKRTKKSLSVARRAPESKKVCLGRNLAEALAQVALPTEEAAA